MVITSKMLMGVIFRQGKPVAIYAVQLDSGEHDVMFRTMSKWEYLKFRLRRAFDWF